MRFMVLNLSTHIVMLFLLNVVNIQVRPACAMNRNGPNKSAPGPFLWDLNESAGSKESSVLSHHNDHTIHEVTSRDKQTHERVPFEELTWGAKQARNTINKPRRVSTNFEFKANLSDRKRLPLAKSIERKEMVCVDDRME